MDEIRTIWKFDDGRERYKMYENKWIVKEKKFGGGKLVLQNVNDKDVIISTISEWKTKLVSKN